MIRLYDDYSEGAHPALLAHLLQHNDDQQPGYGRDAASQRAADRIRAAFAVDADVHFVSGATQANLIVLNAMLRSYQGVIAPSSGHIAVHETGAVEATGHKILTVESPDGKLTPDLIDEALATHEDEHSVMPAALFLTQATEAGTVYSAAELTAVVRHGKAAGLRVFLDGARLSMALASPAAGMTPAQLAATGVDAFTIGGTKVGGIFGEAIVLIDEDLRRDFRYHLKQRGALLAKGRFLGLQFERFFDEDSLWLQLGAAANAGAARLADGLVAAGVELGRTPESNAVFAVLSTESVAQLSKNWGFRVWERRADGSQVVRLMTSWMTAPETIDRFVEAVREASAE